MSDPKILIIDDSAFMRAVLKNSLSESKLSSAIDIAMDGEIGVEKIERQRPDIITLDIEMPKLNGLQVLEKIKLLNKKDPSYQPSILMVSSHTSAHAEITLEALSKGANDFLCKPDNHNIENFSKELLDKVRSLIQVIDGKPAKQREKTTSSQAGDVLLSQELKNKLIRRAGKTQTVIIGSSTGGPKALEEIIPHFSPDWNARFILVQHMPASFTQQFAVRLDKLSPMTVQESSQSSSLQKGKILVATGGKHLVFSSADTITHLDTEPVENVKPAVDVTMQSAVKKIPGDELIGIILTGMGRDGANGMGELMRNGSICLSEDESTCTIYGMPKAVKEAGATDLVIPLQQFPAILDKIFSTINR